MSDSGLMSASAIEILHENSYAEKVEKINEHKRKEKAFREFYIENFIERMQVQLTEASVDYNGYTYYGAYLQHQHLHNENMLLKVKDGKIVSLLNCDIPDVVMPFFEKEYKKLRIRNLTGNTNRSNYEVEDDRWVQEQLIKQIFDLEVWKDEQ